MSTPEARDEARLRGLAQREYAKTVERAQAMGSEGPWRSWEELSDEERSTWVAVVRAALEDSEERS